MQAKVRTECQGTAPKTVKLVESPPTTSIVDSGTIASDLLETFVEVTLIVVDARGNIAGMIWCRYCEVLRLASWRKNEKSLGSGGRDGGMSLRIISISVCGLMCCDEICNLLVDWA